MNDGGFGGAGTAPNAFFPLSWLQGGRSRPGSIHYSLIANTVP
jgi:hypothetical protein